MYLYQYVLLSPAGLSNSPRSASGPSAASLPPSPREAANASCHPLGHQTVMTAMTREPAPGDRQPAKKSGEPLEIVCMCCIYVCTQVHDSVHACVRGYFRVCVCSFVSSLTLFTYMCTHRTETCTCMQIACSYAHT